LEKSFLATHLRTHTGEKEFKCKNCTESFELRSEIIAHEELAHGLIRPYVCDQCPSKFFKQTALIVHQRTHFEKKPFNCPYPRCPRKFTEKGNARTHLKIHVR